MKQIRQNFALAGAQQNDLVTGPALVDITTQNVVEPHAIMGDYDENQLRNVQTEVFTLIMEPGQATFLVKIFDISNL